MTGLGILGPLELRGASGSAGLGGDKPRRLLGALALYANEVLAADRLAGIVWGDSPPQSAHANLLTYLSSLRRSLRSCAGLSIDARPPGYRLLADAECLDWLRFLDLADGAREVRPADPGKAGLLLREALGLWRGPVLADVADGLVLLQPRVAALEEARLAAQVLCVEAEMLAGRHAELLGELAELTGDHPLHEQLRAQHMLALYRCGRQAEALGVFHQLREHLRDELGIDPRPDLGRLYEQILRADPQLDLAPARDPSAAGQVVDVRHLRPVVPRRLPAGGLGRCRVVSQATPLVGRDAEWRQLVSVIAQAGDGAGRMVLVSGEAGIGKTRLCAELSRWHRQRGGRALLGRAAHQEAFIPYAALADALRAARRAEPAVWAAARARAGILWAVASELASEAGGPERSADRPVLFEALLDAIDEAAGDEAMLWVLDDIHRADESTWEFVRYAARRVADLALLLAVTYREEEIGQAHPWWPGLVQLKREPSVLSLPLARLSAADGERMVRAISPALPLATVATIVERGAGTPLLVEELASLASGPGRPLLVPDIVRATVRERTGRLDPAGRALLEAAAVAGLEIDAELLASVLPQGQPGDLVSAGLLDPEEDRFRFRHPLLQEAAYDAVPAGRRRALHEQIAAAMAKSGSHSAERVAYHLERAGRPEAALSVLETAAEAAKRAGQVGRAATLHLGAFQLACRHERLAGRRADLEEAAIQDLFSAGRWSELDLLVRGAWARRSALAPAERAQLAAVFSAHLFWTGSIDQAFQVARDELAALEERGSLDAGGTLLREAALIAWFKGDNAAARAYVDWALDVAQRTSDVDLDIRAGRLEIFMAYGERREPQEAINCLRENAVLARSQGRAGHEAWALLYLSEIAGTSYDLDAARQLSQHAGTWLWLFALREATIQLMEGHREASQAIFSQIRHELTSGIPTIAAWVDARQARLYLHRGDLHEARKLLEGPSAASEASSCGLIGAEWSAALGWLAWEEGRIQEACAHLASAGADSVMTTYNTISAGPAFLALRIDALLRLGHVDEAASAISAVDDFNLGHERFMAAALAAARFRLELTPERAVTAETVTAAAPWPWLHALVGCWRGEFLGDVGAAEGACRQFEQIGAQLGIRRAQAVLRLLGVKLPRHEHGADVLSAREIEVAELVAEGLSNPAIARRLCLSRPTIASHVAHILTKLGFSSRAQIAAWVVQRRTAAL